MKTLFVPKNTQKYDSPLTLVERVGDKVILQDKDGRVIELDEQELDYHFSQIDS